MECLIIKDNEIVSIGNFDSIDYIVKMYPDCTYKNVTFPVSLFAGNDIRYYNDDMSVKTDIQLINDGLSLSAKTTTEQIALGNLSIDDYNAAQIENRQQAYIKTADPLFFMFQRGEITKEEWLAEIDRIKALYPKLIGVM